MDTDLIFPRILIVSRRTVRKNKFVDFVGEYHLDLIVSYGAAPVIVPRVKGVDMMLQSFEPIHGVLLCEGEDIDPSLYNAELSNISNEELDEIRKLHTSDTTIDREKDSIELKLAKNCLEKNIPFLGICRGSQVLNVACGGTLYQDIEKEFSKKYALGTKEIVHMDYENYDGHRHVVKVVEDTPMHKWFCDSLDIGEMEIYVNSYHHQGVNRLAQRFVPMAFAPDGLIEGFYDPNSYDPENGKFVVGLQFHPERMRNQESDGFDYPGCAFVYEEFVKAVIAYKKRLTRSRNVPKGLKFDQELEKMGMAIRRCSSLEPEHEVGSEFLAINTPLNMQETYRLKQMGATVRNKSVFVNRLDSNDEREKAARAIVAKMSIKQLKDKVLLYQKMGKICSEVLERKLKDMNEVDQL